MKLTIASQLAALTQEVKDFKVEIINDVKEIKRQTTYTNGKVANALKEIALLKQENSLSDHYKEFSLKKASVIIGVVAILASITANIILAHI